MGVQAGVDSSGCWLSISLYPHAESSGVLGLAFLGAPPCLCQMEGENTLASFLLCFENFPAECFEAPNRFGIYPYAHT